MQILHKVTAAGYKVQSITTKSGKRVYSITSNDGGAWIRQCFAPYDTREVTILKLRKFVFRCNRLLAEAQR